MQKIANGKIKPLSGSTISRDIKKLYESEKAALIKILKANTSNFSFTTDLWTSPKGVPFMAVTCHYTDDNFKLHCIILDFVFVPGAHTGEAIAVVFKDVLVEFGLAGKAYH